MRLARIVAVVLVLGIALAAVGWVLAGGTGQLTAKPLRAAAVRMPVLARLNPNGATATVKGASVYRLSVGGFARTDAVALCRGLRARGGPCFVRGGVGEQIAAWHKASPNRLAKTAPRGKGAQLAAR